MGDEVADKGFGVKWEGNLIYQHIYDAGGLNTRFIPVLLRPQDKAFIPTPLRGATHYQVDTDEGYNKLYARLRGRPKSAKPKLGKLRPLPERNVKTDFSLYVSTPIDVELWDSAKWCGIFVLLYKDKPPIFGLGFVDEEPARKIFEQWHRRYGERDAFEELRISIIEGEIEGELPGYSVHIGPDLDNTIRRYRDAGLTVNATDHFVTLSRIHRMNPELGSKNLGIFKEAYRYCKTYLLIPGILKPNESKEIKPILDLGIYKNSIHFRTVDEIGPEDEDSVVLGAG